MPRNLLNRLFPSPDKIKSNPALRFFGRWLHEPNLFHLNRYSVSVAFFWGLFVAMIPTPGQMPIAAAVALVFRCNLPITVALVWITNPLTTPFFILLAYHVGAFILQSELVSVNPEFTLTWVANSLSQVWKPLCVGSLSTGLGFGALGYLGIQIFWRWHVARAWKARKLRQNKKGAEDTLFCNLRD